MCVCECVCARARARAQGVGFGGRGSRTQALRLEFSAGLCSASGGGQGRGWVGRDLWPQAGRFRPGCSPCSAHASTPPPPSTPPLQHDAGAQVVQIFDSWAAQLSPQDYDVFCAPYLKYIIAEAKKVRAAPACGV